MFYFTWKHQIVHVAALLLTKEVSILTSSFPEINLGKMERHYVIKQQSEMLQKCFQKSEMHKQKDVEEADEAMNVYQKLQKSEMLKQQKEMSEDDESPWELPETQRFVPIHNVSRAMKKVVPHTGKVAKDAGRSVQVESTSSKKAPTRASLLKAPTISYFTFSGLFSFCKKSSQRP